MSHAEYYKAVVPDPCTVLGLDLLPYSAGHIVLLHRIESPFVVGGIVTEEHLASAVLICSRNFRDGIAALNDPDTPKEMRKWRKVVGNFDLREKAELFQKYTQDGSNFPMVFSPKSNKHQVPITSLAAVHAVRCRLMQYFHIRSDDFWDMPWGLAQWDYYTAPVMEGVADLVEPEAVQSARSFAEQDFRRANPGLFNSDGTLNDKGKELLGGSEGFNA